MAASMAITRKSGLGTAASSSGEHAQFEWRFSKRRVPELLRGHVPTNVQADTYRQTIGYLRTFGFISLAVAEALRASAGRSRRAAALTIAVCIFVCVLLDQAVGQQSSENTTVACGAAAAQAERDWRLPTGLLAAIGIVESGRRGPAGTFSMIWPWTINAEGSGFYQPSKFAAVGMVRSLQQRGVRSIDVGCFQVDLFYHPYAFVSLEEAFDPNANARAAARILSLGRLSSTGWDGAIAAYHSAVPLIGAVYLQKVRAVLPFIRAHPSWSAPESPEVYAVLLSPQARLVRVVTPADPVPSGHAAMPRVMPANDSNLRDRAEEEIQWLHPSEATLPRVLTQSAGQQSVLVP